MLVQEGLGIDIGRVITPITTDSGPSIFSAKNYTELLPRPDALDTIRDLVTQRFQDKVYLVSKCGPTVEARTKELLNIWHFFGKTGINPNNVFFCREIINKGQIASELGLTHFVDDRMAVHNILPETVIQKLLFIPPEEQIPPKIPKKIIPVLGFTGVRQTLL